ncbi:MAG: OmpA family protein [Bacteroidota bacterium]
MPNAIYHRRDPALALRPWWFLVLWGGLFLLSPSLRAQNLVPNPSFEAYEFLPSQLSPTGIAFERAIRRWTTPNEASTDLISPRFKSNNLKPIPPHSGKNMAGIVINGDYWAEYTMVKLRAPLEIGVSYYVEFWISMPQYYSRKKPIPTFLNDHFGVRFDKHVYNNDKRILSGRPQVAANEDILVESNKWIKVSGSFVAETEVQYLYLGQFLSEAEQPALATGYFLIDDVYVESFRSEAVDYVPSSYYKIEEGVASIKMDNIYFETDEHTLLPESYVELDKLVNILQKNPTITIDIQGHTDAEGSEDYNLVLSDKRAAAVRAYLVERGIDEGRLQSQGFGLSQPKADNTTEAGRQENRRVEFVVIGDPVADSRQVLDPEQVYRFSENIDRRRYTDLTFVGRYRRDWDCPELASRKIVDEKLQEQFGKYRPRGARDYLVARTAEREAVFFNESHAHPETRAFVHTLLADLRQQGFSYLCLDALEPQDVELNQRGYPVLNSGYYLKDPVYGDLVRRALDMGFEIVAYQPSPEEMQKALGILERKAYSRDPEVLRQTAQEWSQAMNLARIRRRDSQAKLVVLAGPGHIRERALAGVKPMAQWFAEFTGVNPYTIDQAQMVDYCPEKADPLYQELDLNRSTVFVKDDRVFVQHDFDPGSDERFKRCYDVQIFHPKTVYQNNRPDWLRMNGLRRTYPFNPDKHQMNYPCLVRAYREGEDTAFAIPVDVIEVVEPSTPVALVLPTGTYQLLLKDRQQNKQLTIQVE